MAKTQTPRAPKCAKHGTRRTPRCNECRSILAAIEEGIYRK
jgi:hypothetical protein